MKRVGFFRSIHMKFVLIYVLLILVAMQIIGVYFVDRLEKSMVSNFQNSIKEKVNLLAYNVKSELSKDKDSDTLTVDLQKILQDFKADSDDISEVRILDTNNKIMATSDVDNKGIIDKRIKEPMTKMEIEDSKVFLDPKTKDRVWVLSTPILSDPDNKTGRKLGTIYLEAKIENVFVQLREINNIFATGTVIALGVTAVLGILLAQTITRPMADMKRQALAMAKGNFNRKVKIYGEDEIGQLAMTFNSLTKRLQDLQATTEGERKKLSSVLAFMTDGVIATDRKGRVILINEPAAQLLNVSRETVLSMPIVSLLGIEDDYTFEDLLDQQDSLNLDFSNDDEHYILRANFSVIQKETGFVNGLITVLHDITDQEKIDQERREFVANVSHELRTPLTTMRSYLEALADGAWKDENLAPNFLNVTQNETERMIRLVNDLLQLSKMDSKDYRLKKDWVNFSEFFNHIIDRFEMGKEGHITFKRIIPRKAIFVEIDEDKITQVLYNTISNSIKYSPEGGQLTFRLRELEKSIEISIEDQGVGIPKDKLEKIFERFYRVDKARTRNLGGTGLGLAIAKEMVVAHGGSIWARSIEGKGTTIFFTLPYEDQEDEWE
ncbi:cell wall metabolism sensor histidine kinase WalK [Bacillus testis]|uniref:cell wall metabolism sensor histidine kinase WalK n=1 Tax=Bacillus testis TaxID=1622072 RepID=UPI00067EC0B8|nr:cell wall metabolism sensor histidine kinase WalK [Bacillus testis]